MRGQCRPHAWRFLHNCWAWAWKPAAWRPQPAGQFCLRLGSSYSGSRRTYPSSRSTRNRHLPTPPRGPRETGAYPRSPALPRAPTLPCGPSPCTIYCPAISLRAPAASLGEPAEHHHAPTHASQVVKAANLDAAEMSATQERKPRVKMSARMAVMGGIGLRAWQRALAS